MKKLLISILLIGICAGTAWATDPCERVRAGWQVCAGNFGGEIFYVVCPQDCTKASDWYWNNFETLEKARQYRDMKSADDYAACQTDLQYRKKRKALNEMIWKEIK